ncbi:kinesin-like protein KIF11 [Ciona intestinalis]
MSNKTKLDEKVHVAVRCRPTTESERQSRVKRVVDCNLKSKEINVTTAAVGMGLSTAHTSKIYHFDKVFGPNSTQLDVYKSVVAGQLQDVLAGYNCTVLAYGQTGTGKTYTMEGERSMEDEYTWDTDPRAGIIPRALSQLFDQLEKGGAEYSVRVSLLEIYNEDIYDLLSSSSQTIKMRIYEDNSKKGSVVVSGLTEVVVRNKCDIYDILQQGAAKRRTEATDLNEFSSRSHSIFTATIHTKDVTQNNMEEEELVKIGKLNLVCILAGSENIGKSCACEAGNINTSLLTLGRCITALVEKAPHVPYRESKLTRLLQDSLGGATKTSIIATISPGSDNVEETLSTLDYACRAKNINNKPRVNQKLTKRALIKEYDDEIDRLRREVNALREKHGIYLDPKQYEEMVEKMKELTSTLQQRTQEMDEFKFLFKNSSNELNEIKQQYEILNDDLTLTRMKLAEQTHLKDAYMKHGMKVTDQATELLITAENVTNEIEKVHDKVARVETTNHENLNSTSNFTETMQANISRLNSDTMLMLERNNNSMEKVHDALNNIVKQQKKNISAIKGQVSQWDKAVSVMSQNFQQLHESLSLKLNEGYEENTTAIAQHQETLLLVLQTSMQKLLDFKSQSKHLVETFDLVESTSNQQRQLCEARKQIYASSKKTLDLNISVFNKASDQLIEEQKDDLTAMKNEMFEMVNRNMSSIFTKLESKRAVIKHAVRDVKENALCAHQQMDNNEQQVVQLTNKAEAQISSAVKEYTTNSNQIMDHVEINLHRAVDESNENVVRVLQCQEQLQAEWKTGLEEGLEQVKATKKVSSDFEDSVNESIVTQINKLSSNVDETLQVLTDSNLIIHEDGIKLTSSSESMMSHLDEFQCNMKQVQPTGETPARKKYEYPRSIVNPLCEKDVLQQLLDDDDDSHHENHEVHDEMDEIVEDDFDVEGDDAMSENSDPILNQSITIPDVGGIPFFKKSKPTRSAKKGGNHSTNNQPITRIPLRASQNINII